MTSSGDAGSVLLAAPTCQRCSRSLAHPARPAFMVPTETSTDRRLLATRARVASTALRSLPELLPAWDSTQPLMQALIRRCVRLNADGFTTGARESTLHFARRPSTDGIRFHDTRVETLKVDGVWRRVSAQDLLDEQIAAAQWAAQSAAQSAAHVAGELFLGSLTAAPVFFRAIVPPRTTRWRTWPVWDASARAGWATIRVTVFQGDEATVQFAPEGPRGRARACCRERRTGGAS